MSVEIAGPKSVAISSPAKSFGGGERSSSYTTMFSISKEGNMTKLGGSMNTPKITSESKTQPIKTPETKSSYTPLFSIAKDGQLSKIGDLPGKAETKAQPPRLSPLKANPDFFSQDKVVPKANKSAQQIYLYKRPSEPMKKSPVVEKPTLPTSQVSDEKGKVTEPKLERVNYLFKENSRLPVAFQSKPEVQISEPKIEQTPEIVKQPVVPEVIKPATKAQSPWTIQQAKLLEMRTKDITTEVAPVAPEVLPIISTPKPEAFSQKLVEKTQKVAAPQAAKKIIVNPRVIERPALEALEQHVQKLKLDQVDVKTAEVTDISNKIKLSAEQSLGKIELSTDTQASTALMTSEQAKIEIVTKIQDGAIAVKKMTEILVSQGIDKTTAQEKAIEQTTKMLITTFKAKGLTQYIKSAESAATTMVDSELKLKEAQLDMPEDSEEVENEIDDIVSSAPIRDIVTDAYRIKVARDIGMELLSYARESGQNSVDTSLISESMPERPGEMLASFIRTQLKLNLNSEEQYDSFTDTFAKMGSVSSEQEIISAARAATDVAPAVRLGKEEKGERVSPEDVKKSLRNGSPVRKIIKVTKQLIMQTVTELVHVTQQTRPALPA